MNRNALILSPTGHELIKVGDNAHAQFTTGDYCVSIEWDVDGRDTEPVMCIWPKIGGRGAGCFAICLSSIAKYADPSGNPTPQCFLECWKALPVLGRAQLDIECYRLVDVVLRHTPDLIRCPPAPIAVRRAEIAEPLLEVTTKHENGKTLREGLI
jgi:hypothetical protein